MRIFEENGWTFILLGPIHFKNLLIESSLTFLVWWTKFDFWLPYKVELNKLLACRSLTRPVWLENDNSNDITQDWRWGYSLFSLSLSWKREEKKRKMTRLSFVHRDVVSTGSHCVKVQQSHTGWSEAHFHSQVATQRGRKRKSRKSNAVSFLASC